MADLLLLSREADKQRSVYRKAAAKEAKQRSITKYKSRMRKKREGICQQMMDEHTDRQNMVSLRRAEDKRLVELAHAKQLNRNRTSVDNVSLHLRMLSAERHSTDAATLEYHRDYIARERAASTSPTMFLKLPPLHDNSLRAPVIAKDDVQ